MRDNPVKRKVQAGGHSFGVFAWEFFTPGLAQIARLAGAEYIVLDMEHSGTGIDVVKQQIAYCRGLDIVPMVRVPGSHYHLVAQALDAGAMGVMLPMVETEEQARSIVSWAKYPPVGRRGAAFGMTQDDYAGGKIADKVARANERTFLMLQIETEIGVENAERIAAVPGVDALWVGFLDLSNFLGCPGETSNPKYLQAVDRIVAAAEKHNKVAGVAAATDEWARDYWAKGFRMMTFGPDTHYLQRAWSQSFKEAAAWLPAQGTNE